jgi:hypothetical protein
MSAPIQLPIRVLVKGASTVIWLSEMGGPRSDFAFPRAIEADLLGAGRPAEVRAIGVPSERTKSTLRNWESEILGWSPDVVILMYGHYEAIHFVLPWWLERHANSERARPGLIRERYRKHLLRPAWMALAKLQARADTKFDSTLFRSRPRRVAADLERLINKIQLVGSPLVLVMEILPPGRRWWSWFPGMRERIAVMNEAIAAMVERMDKPNVRIFNVSDVVARHVPEGEEATPDGGHYTPALHRAVGEELAREILAWADTQSHLK